MAVMRANGIRLEPQLSTLVSFLALLSLRSMSKTGLTSRYVLHRAWSWLQPIYYPRLKEDQYHKHTNPFAQMLVHLSSYANGSSWALITTING